MRLSIPIDAILATEPPTPPAAGEALGSSREGRQIVGYRLGRGGVRVSLIAGCHADEPVGPAMLRRLVAHLTALPDENPLLTAVTWLIVPHVNPDGEARNAAWSPPGAVPAAYDPILYLRHAVREEPGDDVEFSFPRSPEDTGARPENLAVASFLRRGAPFALHVSFHGMAVAAGPWFLMEESWADRTVEMRDQLRTVVRTLGYQVHDVDRGGEKGFRRIDQGFSTRPDSRAMAAYFEARGESATAALFRPSSMEFVRSLGGDPLTLVSEMPLFLLPAEHFTGDDPSRPKALMGLRARAESEDPERLAEQARKLGLRAMPIADQMRLQLAYLEAGLEAAQRDDCNSASTRSSEGSR